MTEDHPGIIDPPLYLDPVEARGWRSFFSGRAMVSMRGYSETAGWWKARGHAYALGWASSLLASGPPEAIRRDTAAYTAWIDGRQRHQALTVNEDINRAFL